MQVMGSVHIIFPGMLPHKKHYLLQCDVIFMLPAWHPNFSNLHYTHGLLLNARFSSQTNVQVETC